MVLFEIADYLCQKALEKYGKDIGVIAIYGSFVLGTQTLYSDFDMYAIVDNDAKIRLDWSFVYGGIPVDFWSISWKDAEQLALGGKDQVWSVAASIFHNNKVLYSRSPEDLTRFNHIKEKTNMSPAEHLKIVIDIYSRLFIYPELVKRANAHNDLLSARWAGWNLINSSIEIIARINNKFLTKNWGSNLHQVLELSILPEKFFKIVDILSTSKDISNIFTNCVQLLDSLNLIISQFQKHVTVDSYNFTSSFSDDFVSIKEYIGKVLSACDEKDIYKASYAASELQIWIAEILSKSKFPKHVNSYKFNLYHEIKSEYERVMYPNMSQFIHNHDFVGLETATKKLESMIRDLCKQQEVQLREFSSKEEVGSYLDSLV